MSDQQGTQCGSLHYAQTDPAPTKASAKEPACNRTSYDADQLPQSLSDSSNVKHSLPSMYDLPLQPQSRPSIHNEPLGVQRNPSTPTSPNQKALQSSSTSSKQDSEAKSIKLNEDGKDGKLKEIAKDVEETIKIRTESRLAINIRRELEDQQDDSTTRRVEIPSSPPSQGDLSALVAKRPVSSHQNSSTQQFLDSASTPTFRPGSAPSATPKSPVPKIKLHHPNVDKTWENRIDHAASSPDPNTPLGNSGVSTPGINGDESYFGSSLLLEDGFNSDPNSPDGFDSDPDSQDDSLALVLMSPSVTPHRRSISSELICTPPPGGLNVIWNWITSKRRDKQVQPFFWIALILCRALAERDIARGYVYAFKVTDPQGRGYVKIGFTKGRLTTRMKAHSVCYGTCEQIYPPIDENSALVNHARRVEQLVHAELVEQSISLEKCPKARQKHNCHGEWFDVNPHHAINVIRKWSEWMNSSPYEERLIPVGKIKKRNSAKGATKTAWHLGVLHQDVLMRLCWPTATTADDGETSELGKELGLLTFG